MKLFTGSLMAPTARMMSGNRSFRNALLLSAFNASQHFRSCGLLSFQTWVAYATKELRLSAADLTH
jgi:hypothetical protein